MLCPCFVGSLMPACLSQENSRKVTWSANFGHCPASKALITGEYLHARRLMRRLTRLEQGSFFFTVFNATWRPNLISCSSTCLLGSLSSPQTSRYGARLLDKLAALYL